MVRVSWLISCCTRSQVTRSRKPILAKATDATGTKERPIMAIVGSAAIMLQATKVRSRTSDNACSNAPWMKARAPSRSSMPRVMRSPEWTRS